MLTYLFNPPPQSLIAISLLCLLSSPHTTPAVLGTSGEILLEKILEEDSSYGDPDYYTRNNVGQSPPGLDNDKKLLLGNGHTGAIHMTDI